MAASGSRKRPPSLKESGVTLTMPITNGTEAGVAAMHQAEQIFALGESLPDAVRAAADSAGIRLAVGIPDGLPKLAVRHLLEPVVHEPQLRLLCHDGEFDDLLGELALHKLDLIISDLNMPVMDRPTLITHVRAIDSCKSVPILMLTTQSQQLIKEKPRRPGPPGGCAARGSAIRAAARPVLAMVIGSQ